MEVSKDQDSLELTKDERLLIIDLMVHELFGQEILEHLKPALTSDSALNTTKEVSKASETVVNKVDGTSDVFEKRNISNIGISIDLNNAKLTAFSDTFVNSIDTTSRDLEKRDLNHSSSADDLNTVDQSALLSSSVGDAASEIPPEVSKGENTELTKKPTKIVIRNLVCEFFTNKEKKYSTVESVNNLNLNLSPDEEKILWTIICSKIKKLKFQGKTYNNCSESKENVEHDDNGNRTEIGTESNYKNIPCLDGISTQSVEDLEDNVCDLPTRPNSRRNSQDFENTDQQNNLVPLHEAIAESSMGMKCIRITTNTKDTERKNQTEENDLSEKKSKNQICTKQLNEEKSTEMLVNLGGSLQSKDKELEGNAQLIDLRSSDSSVVCIDEVSPKETIEVDSIGLTSDEEKEIAKIIMLAETEYKRSERKEKIESYECEVDLFLEMCQKSIEKTAQKVSESNGKTDKRIKGGAGGTYDRLTDYKETDEEDENFIKLKWEINGDEFSVRNCDNNLDSNTNQKSVSTKEEFQISWQRSKKRKAASHPTRLTTPMNEVGGPFYIDRNLVPTSLYHDGLMFKRWNPTQVVYEICSQCHWIGPDFHELEFSVARGFHFGVRVNERNFVPEQRGHSKQRAKHCASAQFLNFLGFKFDFNSHSNIVSDFVRPDRATRKNRSDESVVKKELNYDLVKWEDTDKRGRSRSRSRYFRGECDESRTFKNYQAFRDYLKNRTLKRERSRSSDSRYGGRRKRSQSPASRTRITYKRAESRNETTTTERLTYKRSHRMEPSSSRHNERYSNQEFEKSNHSNIRIPMKQSCSLWKRKRDSSSSSDSDKDEKRSRIPSSKLNLDHLNPTRRRNYDLSSVLESRD